MAAAKTQNRASANAGRTTAQRGSQSRASSSRSRKPAARSGGRATTARSRSAAPARSRTKAPSRTVRPAGKARRRERGPSATTLFVIASIIFAAWTIYPVLRIQYIEQRNVATLEAELSGLKDRNAVLRTQVDELKTPEGVEEIARETLGLVKPGEQAYVVTGASAETTETPAAGEGSEPFWQQALDLVFGLK